MTEFTDEVLGLVKIRRNPLSRSIRMRLSPTGDIVVSAPKHIPIALIKKSVRDARAELTDIKDGSKIDEYTDAQQIGHSHRLSVVSSDVSGDPRAKLVSRNLIVYLPQGTPLSDASVQSIVRSEVRKVLRKEAKAYLPRRLSTLAKRYGYSYESVRFPHTISRWGSCSSRGTISLNIALMKLPLDLIDYVIVHELSHTVHMNHSREFWREVESHDPDFRAHKKAVKQYSPII